MAEEKTVLTPTDLSVKLQMNDKHSKQVMYTSQLLVACCMLLLHPAQIFPQAVKVVSKFSF